MRWVVWGVAAVLVGGSPLTAQNSQPSLPANVLHYTAYRASPGISLDGRLNEAAWEATPWTESFSDIRGQGHRTPTWETGAKLLWDDQYL